jgi:hypothetical protein
VPKVGVSKERKKKKKNREGASKLKREKKRTSNEKTQERVRENKIQSPIHPYYIYVLKTQITIRMAALALSKECPPACLLPLPYKQ